MPKTDEEMWEEATRLASKLLMGFRAADGFTDSVLLSKEALARIQRETAEECLDACEAETSRWCKPNGGDVIVAVGNIEGDIRSRFGLEEK